MLSDFARARVLAWSDFRHRYHETALGYLWSVLTPLITLAILYTVFSVFMNFQVENYQLFLLLGIVLFNFFSEATREAMHSLSRKRDLVKKVAFPRHVIVLSSVMTSGAYLLINLGVFMVFMAAFGIFPGITALYLPVTLLELFLLVFGLGYGLSALYVRYGDLGYIWDFVLMALFWVTPIFYDYDLVAPKYVKLYMLNPLARIISTSREILISNHIPLLGGVSGWVHELITLAICAVVFVLGVWLFRSRQARFAEYL